MYRNDVKRSNICSDMKRVMYGNDVKRENVVKDSKLEKELST